MTGEPGRTSWPSAIADHASRRSAWATAPAIVTGPIAPARMNGTITGAWLASA